MGVFASQPSLMLNALTIQHQPCACRSYVPYPSPSTSPLIPCHDSHGQGGTQLQLQKLAIEIRVSHAYILHITFTEGICDFVTQKLVMFLIKSHNVFLSIVPVAFLNSSTPHATRQNLQAWNISFEPRNTTLLDPSRGSSFLWVSSVESSNLPFPLSFYYVQQIRIVRENVLKGNTLVPGSKRKMEARREKQKR